MKIMKRIIFFVFTSFFIKQGCAVCKFPSFFHGDYYSEQNGYDVEVKIDPDNLEQEKVKHECHQMYKLTANDINDRRVLNQENHRKIVTVSTKDKDNKPIRPCHRCFYILWRTPNILQYKTTSSCSFDYTGNPDKICENFPKTGELVTLYKLSITKENCRGTFEGVYQFSYQLEKGGGGICDHRSNRIEACQLPGSKYVENTVVDFSYKRCIDVSTSLDNYIRYQCLGWWQGEDNYIYAGLAKTVEKNPKERFRCLLTRADQRPKDNKFRWTKTRFTECKELLNTYDGYERLVVQPITPITNYMVPACNLPRNISGSWFTVLQHDTEVKINDTHIYMRRKESEFKYIETYFSCQRQYETRYMMTAVTVGRCEVDFVCLDLMPRHHSVVRYRIGKPTRAEPLVGDKSEYIKRTFRSVCDWLSFTRDRKHTDWKYNVFILDPPTPVPCPIAGRYNFVQTPSGKIKHTIRSGATEKPRMKVDCRRLMPIMSSCSADMSRIELDVDYCETVDYKGRPIGEYDEPDIVMNCVGYWMEDMRSFLITYDEHDEFSRFRCWVYKRISWTEIALSRSTRATCFAGQDATAYRKEFSDLHLEISESERLFDMCPQRFQSGYDPYQKPLRVYVVASAPSVLYFTGALTFMAVGVLDFIL